MQEQPVQKMEEVVADIKINLFYFKIKISQLIKSCFKMNITQNSLDHLKLINNCSSHVNEQPQQRTSAYQSPAPHGASFRQSAHHVAQYVPNVFNNQVVEPTLNKPEYKGIDTKISPGVMDASSKKVRYYNQNPVKDPYAQVSNSGFTPIGNMKTYDVANMYDRSEPTRLRDLPEIYTVPYSTTPFLGNNTTSVKYVDIDSTKLRYPVFLNRKSAVGTSEVTIHPQQVFIKNEGVSEKLNNFYEQATTINLLGADDQTFSTTLDPTKTSLGQRNYGLDSTRYINRWDIVDPSVVQNVDHIIMNIKKSEGGIISLFPCGVSTRNELRNYVEINNC